MRDALALLVVSRVALLLGDVLAAFLVAEDVILSSSFSLDLISPISLPPP